MEERGLSVCLSVNTVSPAKTAEPIVMTFGMSIEVGLRDHVQIPHANRQFGGGGVGISLHAVDQPSKWPAAEPVECHINSPNEKSQCDAASRQNSLIIYYDYYYYYFYPR